MATWWAWTGWTSALRFITFCKLYFFGAIVKIMTTFYGDLPRLASSASPGPKVDSGARQESLRHHNLALLAGLIVQSPTPPSRSDLAVATGLTRPTVTRLVEQLISAGLAIEEAPITSIRVGRPAVPLAPAPRTYAAIGLELNIDYLEACLVDMTGEIIVERMREWDLRGNEDPRAVLGHLGAMASRLGDQAVASGLKLAGIGFALPGLVTTESGRLLTAPNLGWSDLDPLELLHLTGAAGEVAAYVGNEASLAARAECAARARRDGRQPSFLYLSGHVGFGSAIIRGGRFLEGTHGWGGELGHMCIHPDGPRCVCGARGCLECYAGVDALKTAAGMKPDQTLGHLFAALERHEHQADQAVRQAGTALGIALANTINLLDIDEVVFGNVYLRLLPYLRPAIEHELRDRLVAARWTTPMLTTATAGERIAAAGAALTALNALVASPERWTKDRRGRRPYLPFSHTPVINLVDITAIRAHETP